MTESLSTLIKEIEPEIVNERNSNIKTWADLQSMLGPIKFDWSSWLARGFLTIVAGASGNGKSILALRIAGCYLLGQNFPDGSDFTGETGAILWCEAEAAQALNLERATNWNYPLERIYTPFLDDPLMDIDLENEKHKKQLVDMASRTDVKMIIVDSLSGSNHKRRENDPEIMNITRWLAELSRDLRKPFILTHHLNKKREFDQDEVTLDRLRGSSAIAQHARVIWAVDTPDKTDRDAKRLSVIKNNFARFPEPIGFKVNDDGIVFTDAPEPPHEESQLEKAVDLLLALLADKPMPSTWIEKEARGAGISWRTMNAAKKEMGIVSKRCSDGWYWGLVAQEWLF